METMRLDKWLWVARFYKGRSLAVTEIKRGRVQVNGRNAKPARDVVPGDLITIKKTDPPMHVEVLGMAATRGPASVAQTLYKETAQSRAAREQALEQRRLAPEPAHTIRDGRPTKRNRRKIQRFHQH